MIRIGALISGSGSNLAAVIRACEEGQIDGQVVFAGADNAAAAGLDHARNAGIHTFIVDYKEIIAAYRQSPEKIELPRDYDPHDVASKVAFLADNTPYERIKEFLLTRAVAEARMLADMAAYPFDLLILAGFMRNLTPYFIDRVNIDKDRPRIMNIHPALLPSFPGVDGYGDTFQYGCKVGGCTVHFIDYGEDSGPIIGQRSFDILPDDTIETVKKKGLSLEWELYPACIQLFAENRLQVVRRAYKRQGGGTFERMVVEILPSA
ncbi:MAG: phosphoribosylglycinamide formyltransferase [Thermodesulfobacteriota bacterium]|nr:phosphoribosylglycinamide formyltransferase [Thermodesulfobacteriota bacterium]